MKENQNERKTIVERLETHARDSGDKIAIIESGRETSYRELWNLVRSYSAFLKESGVKKGDVVLTRASQSLDFALIYLATHLSLGVIAPLEKNFPASSVQGVAEKLSARFVIADDIHEGGKFSVLPRKNVIETAKTFPQGNGFDFPSLSDSADILFTTGTTGSAKGVELTHRAISATAENLICGCGYKSDTVIVVPGPLNHANAIRKLFTSIYNGSAIYILSGMLNLSQFFRALDYPTGSIACCLPPAAIRTIFQNAGEKFGEYKGRIDFIESATSPLPEPDKERLRALLPGTRLYNNYGSSEAASVCMYDYAQFPGKKSCVGKMAKNSRVIIVDDERNEIESSESNTGLIACAGDVVMKGYVGERELTFEVLSDGIIYTNDVGYIDSDGFVYVSGRRGDVINVGGLKVPPSEVESCALSLPEIADCICIPVKDKISGNALKLLVVMKDGERMDSKKIASVLRKTLEPYKVPHIYEEVDEVKRTYNGKLDRKAYSTSC